MFVPPKTPRLLLRVLSSPKDNAYWGDIEELFHFRVETLGLNRARRPFHDSFANPLDGG
jgi:hypothetical protein